MAKKVDGYIKLNIPAGVEEGMQLKVSGQGNAGPFNGIAGDLLVILSILWHVLTSYYWYFVR